MEAQAKGQRLCRLPPASLFKKNHGPNGSIFWTTGNTFSHTRQIMQSSVVL
jgi:hypothetical protein